MSARLRIRDNGRLARIINLAGKRFGRVVVLRLSDDKRQGARWVCRCDCGAEFTVLGFNLKDAGPNYACPTCRPRGAAPRRAAMCCGICGSSQHNRATCPRRTPATRNPLACFGCAGLPHRRPINGACVCGGTYEAEPAITIDDVMAMPARHPREVA